MPVAPVAGSKLLSILILFSGAASAELTSHERTAIEVYLSTARIDGLSAAERAEKDFLNRANKLEAQINPLLAISQRREDLMSEEKVWIENGEKHLSDGRFLINPWDDKIWEKSALKNVNELCCAIKADPAWRTEIQERVARGLPPLEGKNNAPSGGAEKTWPGKKNGVASGSNAGAGANASGAGQKAGRGRNKMGKHKGQGAGGGKQRGGGNGGGAGGRRRGGG